jgi:hypothetical protein
MLIGRANDIDGKGIYDNGREEVKIQKRKAKIGRSEELKCKRDYFPCCF